MLHATSLSSEGGLQRPNLRLNGRQCGSGGLIRRDQARSLNQVPVILLWSARTECPANNLRVKEVVFDLLAFPPPAPVNPVVGPRPRLLLHEAYAVLKIAVQEPERNGSHTLANTLKAMAHSVSRTERTNLAYSREEFGQHPGIGTLRPTLA